MTDPTRSSASNADTQAVLDAATARLLDAIRRARSPGYIDLGPQAARAVYEQTASLLDVPAAALARVDDWHDPGFRVRRYCPHEPELARLQPALLYFHGGGFTIGSVATHDRVCRTLAAQSGCMVLSVDYRLAPEHRFPAAADDAFTALTWLRDEAISLGIDSSRLAVGGDSAGGTLAAACALLARDRGWPLALHLLIYPGLAPWQDSPSHRRFAHGYLLDAPLIQWFFNGYLRGDTDRDDWRFAPLVHPDLSGLAPVWLGLAQCDPLVDEGLAYAERLRVSGVAVDATVYAGMVHGFFQFGGLVPRAREAHRDAARVLRRHLQPDHPLSDQR